MTKAERIYRETLVRYIHVLMYEDFEERYTLCYLVKKDGEFVHVRTLNAISKLIKRRRELIESVESLPGERVPSLCSDEVRKKALDLLEQTVNTELKILRIFNVH